MKKLIAGIDKEAMALGYIEMENINMEILNEFYIEEIKSFFKTEEKLNG